MQANVDAGEPRAQLAGRPIGAAPLPGDDEGVLRQVAPALGVTDQEAGQAAYPGLVT
jgi:hypothetical protein